MCLDSGSSFILYSCHGYGGNQFFALAKSGQIIVIGVQCVGINLLNKVVLVPCSDTDKTQLWTYIEEVGDQIS